VSLVLFPEPVTSTVGLLLVLVGLATLAADLLR
jgi:hypothetical protein